MYSTDLKTVSELNIVIQRHIGANDVPTLESETEHFAVRMRHAIEHFALRKRPAIPFPIVQ